MRDLHEEQAMVAIAPKGPNTEERLRQLLMEIYTGVLPTLGLGALSDDEANRLLDIVLAAGEGEPFADLGLPFPRL